MKNERGVEMAMREEFTVAATVENIGKVTGFMDEQLERYGCPIKAQMQIDVAVDRLFGDIVHYAHAPETEPGAVRVEVLGEPLKVMIAFVDNRKQTGSLETFLEERGMDAISYEYREGQNILKIKKKPESPY